MQAIATALETREPELDELSLRRAQQRHGPSFRVLVERYQPAVWSLLWRMLEREFGAARVEDLCQETFLRVYRALPDFRTDGPARLSTWVLTIATRLARARSLRASG